MDRHQLKVMINKEYRELVNDRGLMFSLLIIPIIFSIVLPILLFILGTRKEVSASIVGLNTFIEQFKMIKYPDYLTRGTVPFYVIFTYFFYLYLCYYPLLFLQYYLAVVLLVKKSIKLWKVCYILPSILKSLF